MASSSQLLQELLSLKVLLVCLAVMLNPLVWNLAARLEYTTHAISRIFGGPRRGIIAVALAILGMNYLRTSLFHSVMEELSTWDLLKGDVATAVGYIFVVLGAVLVLTCTWQLGFFCTFLGDYFGILLDSKVTEFPFNIVEDPMYWGSFMIHMGTSLQHASFVGFLLTGCIGLSYIIAMQFEGPFTAMIYAKRDKSKTL